MNTVIFHNTVKAYCFAGLMFCGTLAFCLVGKRQVVTYLGKIAAKTVNDFDDFLVTLIAQIGVPVFVIISIYTAVSALIIPETARFILRIVMVVVVTRRAVLMLQDVARYGVTKAYNKRVNVADPSAAAMIKNLTSIIRLVIWSLGVLFVLSNLGINVSALVAGVGIGGVAVALAAQAILGDAFSAVSIFLDKPFAVGDFIIIDDHMGTVEYVGIKTTRVRSLSGEQLIFSNSDLTRSRIKNYKRMDSRRVAFKIGVVYNTPVEVLKKVPAIVKDIVGGMQGVRLDRVHFQSFGDFSLNFEIVYYVLSADYNIYMDKQQEMNFALMEAFKRDGIEFAYPTQTLYCKQFS
ncbi:MAG: mechanosensitive ion channel family protein [Candidatus Omnitrophica bacterium]|nr:mechanosensitive ion channel family protein [Candidatus Omnitrophota bacterium]